MDTTSIATVDLVLGIAVALFAIRGLFRGLVRELFSLAAVVVGWFVATRYHFPLAERLPGGGGEGLAGNVIAFALLFLGAAFAVSFAGKAFHKLLSETPLGWINRLLGAACGLLIGTILVGLVLLVLTVYVPQSEPYFAGSRLYPRLTGVVLVLAEALPDKARELFEKHFENGEVKLPEKLEDII